MSPDAIFASAVLALALLAALLIGCADGDED